MPRSEPKENRLLEKNQETMKWLFRSSRKESKNTKRKPSHEGPSVHWPTALERVAAARRARTNGSTFMPTRTSTSHTRMLFCPVVGKELLKRHEDCRLHDNVESDDEESDDDKKMSTAAKTLDPTPTRLHKPVKPNRLLAHALTNANGGDWRRQRPLVQRALGDASVTKKVAIPAAIKAALNLLKEEKLERHVTDIEARSFSLNVATSTMIAAVFGAVLDRELYHRLVKGIKDLFHDNLLPVRGDAEKAAALDRPVREMVNTIDAASSDACDPCLAHNLLAHKEKASSLNNKPSLTMEEVIGNCHSALLAGTQTIATTLAGAMLHLAEFEDNGIVSNRAWFRAVVNETLRILPPVASLPRSPVHGNIAIANGEVSITLPEGGVLLMDVLSMAHCPIKSQGQTQCENNNGSTWKYCPTTPTSNKQEQKKRPVPQAYPWGFGDRACPAGNLSVSCISAVLTTLVVEENLSWVFSDPTANSVGPLGTKGWIENVSYQPTLTYPKPIWLAFSRASEDER